MKVRNYQDLIVWQKAMDLVEQIYAISQRFPREEIYGLTSQLRRAAVSIPSNIAEGQGRRTTADFLRHLSISYGSLRELETQTLIATRLQYLTKERCQDILRMAGEVGRLLNGQCHRSRGESYCPPPTAHSPLVDHGFNSHSR